jgi:predicted dehydrogenase
MDGVFNLTPAPFHRETSGQALDAGHHVFTEKPIAATVEDALALIGHAESSGRLLMSAPAVMATLRFRWLKQIIASGRIGRLTLATAQMANMGPAGWRQYTGDPAVFYTVGVGPLLDIGVYSLHAITGLFGPATRVQAMGGIAIPERTVTIPRIAGQKIAVTAPDVMSVQLDFSGRAWAQILASFAVPRSHVPALEIHGTKGTISVSADAWYHADGPVDLFVRDETPLGAEGWMKSVASPEAGGGGHLIGSGPEHFIAVLSGTEEPILSAAHACHVLEIMLSAERSRAEGRAIELETSF